MTTYDSVAEVRSLLDATPPRHLERLLAGVAIRDEVALIERAVMNQVADSWRATPAAMAVHLAPQEVIPKAHTLLLGQKFADAVEGRSKRQIWNLPARYGKTLMGSVWGPTWCLDRFPQANLILVSYADLLANENAGKVRDRLELHRAELRVTLRPDRRARGRFVTPEGGGLLAAGLLAGITGFGAGAHGGIVLDDPFKNWQEAHSETIRQRVWDEFRSVLELRLDDDTAWVIVIQTRWHEDDLTGRILQRMAGQTGEHWELVRLPALAEPHDPAALDYIDRLPDPLGREPGEPLDPERFPLAAVHQRAANLGSYLAAGLEQQRPAPEEGGDVKRAWWRWEDSSPVEADAWITSWDTKLKDTEAGDFVVGQAWARVANSYHCVDQLRGQWSQATTKVAIALMRVRHPQIGTHYVENTGFGPEVMAELRAPSDDYALSDDVAGQLGITAEERPAVEALLRRGMTGLLPVTVKGSKAVRVRAVSPIIESGHVYLPLGRPWADHLVAEAAAFPNGSHDDQVDALSQALAKLANAGASATPPPAERRIQPLPAGGADMGAGVLPRRGTSTRPRRGQRRRP